MLNEDVVKKAVLVAIQLPGVSVEDLEGSLQELRRLVKTLGYQVLGQVVQKRKSDKRAIVLGEGKMRELAEWTGGTGVVATAFEKKKNKATLRREKEEDADDKQGDEEDEIFGPEVMESPNKDADGDEPNGPPDEIADFVIVDSDLSPTQLRNLESAVGVPVLDRTGVIIEIFSRHAKTRAAKAQVEIARLSYLAPRLRETGGAADRQVGGGGRGGGESQLELDRRKIRDRIKELKENITAIGNEQDLRRARRQEATTVALVGYTNAGKSSLMRAMTGSEVLVENKLFATLDTTIRPLYPASRPKILLSDTVGFVKKLPHDLVASFKSTLDEALSASLLLFVVDVSDASFRSQLDVTTHVLDEVGALGVPRFLIFNKRDLLTNDEVTLLSEEFPDAIFISTQDADDLRRMREKILSYFEEEMVDEDVFVPFLHQSIVSKIRARARILSETYGERGVLLKVRATPETFSFIHKKLMSSIEG